jgi:hypothetical protein
MNMYEAIVASDLYNAGNQDDGQPFIAEVYYVVVENERGRRFAHKARFKGTAPRFCNETGEGPFFPDLRGEAFDKAAALGNRIAAALRAGRKLDASHWSEIDPAYASKEYEAQGTEFQRWLEDKESA